MHSKNNTLKCTVEHPAGTKRAGEHLGNSRWFIAEDAAAPRA